MISKYTRNQKLSPYQPFNNINKYMKDTKILGVDNVNLYCLLVKSNSVTLSETRVAS